MYIYQLGRLRRLILFMDYPPIYQLGRLRRLIFLVLDNPQIIHILDSPPNNFLSRLISCTHSYSPRVFQCIWNACMPIPIQSNSHVNI